MTRRILIAASIVLGLGGLSLGFAVAPVQTAFAYLTAWTFAVSIAVGALVLLMMGHAVGARWILVFRTFIEAMVRTLPLLALLFVPIACNLHLLYVWADPSAVLSPELAAELTRKASYLAPGPFIARTAIYFAAWIVLGELLVRWSASKRSAARCALSCAGLPLVGLTLTFAAFDWLMSLTPAWSSAIFGLIYFFGGFVAALGLVAVLARLARRLPLVARSIGRPHNGALGRMILAFLCMWAYVELSQGLIIWIADKPDEVPWYVARGAGGWGGLLAVLIIGHFTVPFFLLLSRELKRRATAMAWLGAWLVVMHFVDVYWLVMPVLHPLPTLHWLDAAAPLGVLGLVTAFAFLRSRRQPAIPADDPQLAEALRYEGT
jgi:hypothetical protein